MKIVDKSKWDDETLKDLIIIYVDKECNLIVSDLMLEEYNTRTKSKKNGQALLRRIKKILKEETEYECSIIKY